MSDLHAEYFPNREDNTINSTTPITRIKISHVPPAGYIVLVRACTRQVSQTFGFTAEGTRKVKTELNVHEGFSRLSIRLVHPTSSLRRARYKKTVESLPELSTAGTEMNAGPVARHQVGQGNVGHNNLGSEVLVLMDPISKSSWGSFRRESGSIAVAPHRSGLGSGSHTHNTPHRYHPDRDEIDCPVTLYSSIRRRWCRISKW